MEADFEPVVIIWHDEFSRHAAILDMKNLPLKLHTSLSEERPVIVVNGEGKKVNLSSLQGEWSEGTFMEPLKETHVSQIATFKSKLLEKGQKTTRCNWRIGTFTMNEVKNAVLMSTTTTPNGLFTSQGKVKALMSTRGFCTKRGSSYFGITFTRKNSDESYLTDK